MSEQKNPYENQNVLNWHMISRYRGEIYGISMLWIMTFHVAEFFPKIGLFKHTLGQIMANGMIGVDIFLFISGISLYFSMKKHPQIRILDFYKKRFQKIGWIYLIFCLPFLIYMHLIYKNDSTKFFQQLTFTSENHSSFWFLICIAVCYLIYPLIFHLLESQKRGPLWIFCAFYMGGILIVYAYFPDLFLKYNISLGRLPIFLLGALCGPAVYCKKKIPTSFYLLMIALLFISMDTVVIILQKLNLFQHDPTYYLVSRLRMGLQGIGSVFFLLPFLPILTQGKVGSFLRYTGSITLELYVLHVIYRILLNGPLGFRVTSILSRELFLVTMFILSYATVYIYQKLKYLLIQRG